MWIGRQRDYKIENSIYLDGDIQRSGQWQRLLPAQEELLDVGAQTGHDEEAEPLLPQHKGAWAEVLGDADPALRLACVPRFVGGPVGVQSNPLMFRIIISNDKKNL